MNHKVVPRPYQKEAVDFFLASPTGYWNSCGIGTGKTLMALWGCREIAKRNENQSPGYRMLVITSTVIRNQWVRELQKEFPEAMEVELTRDTIDQLPKLMEAPFPVAVVCSYASLRLVHQELGKYAWDDFVLDQNGRVLTSPGSKTTQALWKLRPAAKRASYLGTCVHELQDVSRILAWIENDPKLAHMSSSELSELAGKRIYNFDPQSFSQSFAAKYAWNSDLDLSGMEKFMFKKSD